MDNEKRYKEAIERAKESLETAKTFDYKDEQIAHDIRETVYSIFPELKESEDERIRKVLIELVKCNERSGYTLLNNISTSSMLAWLEKQKKVEIDDDDLATLENWESIVKENKDKWQLSDWFIEATSMLINKVKNIDISGNKTMLTACTNVLRNIGHPHLADWLEKQGEQKHTWSEEDERLRKTTIAFLKDFAEQGYENAVECIDWLKTQGDKPQGKSALEAIKEEVVDNANKVGPKFKVGDFIADYYCRGRIVKITDDSYLLDTGQGIPFSCEPNAHLWTIKDAKEGDVVVDKSDGTIGIFQSIGHHPDGGSCNDSSYCFLHCRYDDGFFYADFEHGNTINSDDLIPATKEQRDLLFTKMKEAGYKWDENEKELKKIEQKSTNKVEPKFTIEKGKWYVCNISRYTDFVVGKAYYCSINGTLKPNENAIARYVARDCFHPWTIEDAKDGDVLTVDDERPFIFKGCFDFNHPDSPVAYCGIDTERYFCVGGSKFNHWWTEGKVQPATKEQRDLLFAKMKEADYEWDAEKKELKKISQRMISAEAKEALYDKVNWSEEDDNKVKEIIEYLNELYDAYEFDVQELNNYETWLKSIKQRLGGEK